MTDPSAGKSQQQTVALSPVAHAKMILHAARNPTSQVHGILVGSFGAGPVLNLQDAVPVFHSAPTKPILDMALRLAEAHIGSSGGEAKLSIVGWYTANERMGDDQPGQAALRIMGGVASRLDLNADPPLPAHAEPVLILVRNEGMVQMLRENSEDTDQNGLVVFGRDSWKHWLRPVGSNLVKVVEGGKSGGSWSASNEVAKAACCQDTVKLSLFDFEDHLECGDSEIGKRDWLTNSAVSNFVRKNG